MEPFDILWNPSTSCRTLRIIVINTHIRYSYVLDGRLDTSIILHAAFCQRSSITSQNPTFETSRSIFFTYLHINLQLFSLSLCYHTELLQPSVLHTISTSFKNYSYIFYILSTHFSRYPFLFIFSPITVLWVKYHIAPCF